MAFNVNGVEFGTSTWSETDWRKQCVGVGSACTCHRGIADSKTADNVLWFDNREFTAFIAAL